MVRISPSILAGDFTDLRATVKSVEKYVDSIHVDVIDGVFAPNITFGIPIVDALRNITSLPLDVHLMIVEPDRYLKTFVDHGASSLWVHVESCPHLHRTIMRIKELGVEAFVCLNPATPLSAIEEILPFVDGVLIMTVNPGFSGQKFIPQMTTKITKLKKMINERNLSIHIAVDGGIDETNLEEVVKCGADTLIMGSGIFAKESPGDFVRSLKETSEVFK